MTDRNVSESGPAGTEPRDDESWPDPRLIAIIRTGCGPPQALERFVLETLARGKSPEEVFRDLLTGTDEPGDGA